jgi:hypothetical protein
MGRVTGISKSSLGFPASTFNFFATFIIDPQVYKRVLYDRFRELLGQVIEQGLQFEWLSEAEQLVRAQGHQSYCSAAGRASKREQVISRLMQMSGNPRGACLRFMRRLGLAPQRSYREWTTGEQRHLIELIEEVPIRETAKILRRSSASIRSMLHRLGLGARQNREWFTVSLLAQALHISRPEVQWIRRESSSAVKTIAAAISLT